MGKEEECWTIVQSWCIIVTLYKEVIPLNDTISRGGWAIEKIIPDGISSESLPADYKARPRKLYRDGQLIAVLSQSVSIVAELLILRCDNIVSPNEVKSALLRANPEKKTGIQYAHMRSLTSILRNYPDSITHIHGEGYKLNTIPEMSIMTGTDSKGNMIEVAI